MLLSEYEKVRQECDYSLFNEQFVQMSNRMSHLHGTQTRIEGVFSKCTNLTRLDLPCNTEFEICALHNCFKLHNLKKSTNLQKLFVHNKQVEHFDFLL